MSVYTPVSRAQLQAFLRAYPLAPLVDHQGITAGIANTNYFVTTEDGEFVLTLFEELRAHELPYFLELMAFLAEHGIPSAHPLADREGRYLRELNGKPAALVERLRGHGVDHPTPGQCRALGAALGRMHRATPEFPHHRPNDLGPHWWRVTGERVLPCLAPAEAELLRAELEFQKSHRRDTLPRGVVHADLFRDNALFEGEELRGIIDFYYACDDVLLFDVAVTANDWCSNADGALDPARLNALLGAYARERAFSAQEQASWPALLRAAALRFWVSRLHDWHFPKAGELTHTKDPTVFQRILQQRLELPAELARLPGVDAR
jgi:homoserine kinase type II